MREARIDAAAIEANTRAMAQRVGGARIMAVVKANGYGHGALTAARAALAGGADRLGVVDLDEAFSLRAAGITAPILTWLHAPDADFAAAVAARIDLGVSSIAQVERAAQAAHDDRIAELHIKVDTGLGRNGVTADDAHELFARAAQLEREGRVRVTGLFSHLSGTSDDDDDEQAHRFGAAVAAARAAGLAPEHVHLAASGSALRGPIEGCTMVRLGISLYGLSPIAGVGSAELGLRPAMELAAPVVAVKRVPAGQGVSYGYRYRTERAATLALVPLGYADGVPRAASDRAPVSIGGRRFTISGVVAMDQFVVDVGDHPVAVGDRVVLFGDPAHGVPSADEWADACGTINYEIVTRVGERVTRTIA